MSGASERLRRNSKKIMTHWEGRVKNEITATFHKESFALQDSLPQYLQKLAEALSVNVDRSELRRKFNLEESARIGRIHGRERAESANYTVDQLIFEYHILRQVIFDVMEEEAPFTDVERELIVCSIEQAVNDAATQFSDTLRDVQKYFSHSIAHDLRNYILAAKMEAQSILLHPDDVASSKKTANSIANSMDRLDSLIHDFLDAGRLQAGQSLPLQFEECDLDLITKEIANEFNYSIGDRFVVKSPGPTLGYWSKSGLNRIIKNLASNAEKYGTPNTPISITIQKSEHTVLLSVHNEGNPIPPEEQTILFQRYRRGKSAEKETGWGLGLTIVKGIVESHQGRIFVKSAEGIGTSFSVELPIDSRKQGK